MRWFGKKNEDASDKDEVYDLDTVVWRGISQEDRLNRLADAAGRAEDHHRHYPSSSPLYEPSRAAPIDSLYQPGENPVPEDDLHEASNQQPVVEAPAAEPPVAAAEPVSAPEAETPAAAPMVAAVPSAEESLISDAMNSVLKSETFAASIRAEIEKSSADANPTPVSAPETTPVSTPAASTSVEVAATPADQVSFAEPGIGPDLGNAVKAVVRDEIGSWMQENMNKIVAESFSNLSLEKMIIDARQQAMKAQAPKTRAKSPKAKAGKTGRRAGIGQHEQRNIVSMKARDQSS